MKLILLATAAVIVVSAADLRPVQAYEAPWCAVVSKGKGTVFWDCQYRTFEGCLPHVIAGDRGFCNQNPSYSVPAEPKKKRVARRRHRETR